MKIIHIVDGVQLPASKMKEMALERFKQLKVSPADLMTPAESANRGKELVKSRMRLFDARRKDRDVLAIKEIETANRMKKGYLR